MSNKVNRGERVLNRAVSAHKLTECGMKALIAAVDPFHDKPIDGLRGWPDHETGPSVIRHWKQSTTVKAIEEGGSIMIQTLPILDEAICYLTTRRNAVVDSISPGISTDISIGPVNIYNYTQAQSGAADLALAAVTSYHHAVPDSYFQDGACRLIGMGFEVHDVTAEIYKQGTCTVFEVPETIADTESVFVKGQTVSALAYAGTSVDVARLSRFPPNLSAIMTYPTSKQWDAKEGAYVVVPFGGHENPPMYAQYRSPWINVNGVSVMDYPDNSNNGGRYLGRYLAGGVGGDPFVFMAHQYAPVNSRGCYLSGLNANSTFTITTSFFFESFPTSTSNLLPLASPSCCFDARALALISTIMQEMPVGVPVRENPLGEWFWSAIEAALPTIGVAASAIFPEFAPIIGTAAVAGTNYAAKQHKQAVERNQKKKALKNEVKQMVKADVAELARKKNKR